MADQQRSVPQVPIAAPKRHRPRDNCRSCRKSHGFCVNIVGNSGLATGSLMIFLFLISIAILGFTGAVGKYFLPVANAWRNALSGATMFLTILALVTSRARFQNVLFVIAACFNAIAWAYAVIATFDGNQVYSIYSDCNDIYNVVKAMPTFDATKWVCPLWGDQSPQQVEGMVDGAVILCLIATALWLFASSVVHRRASVIAQQVEDEQKLFDSLGHVGPGEGATAPGV